MPLYYSQIAQSPQQLAQPETNHPHVDSSPTSGFLVLALFLSCTLAGVWYKRHRINRQATLLKRQIAMLEAMWQKSPTNK